MNRAEQLFQSDVLRVARVDHPPHREHRDGGVEVTQRLAVTFVERGAFRLEERGTTSCFGALDVLRSAPGAARVYAHASSEPDDVCLSLAFGADVVEDALGRLPSSPLAPRVAASAATAYAYRRIRRALDAADALAVESVGFDSVALLGPHGPSPHDGVPGAAAHARRIERACELMRSRIGEEQSLAETAREAGLSVFHFARVFRTLVGEPPHQYLLRMRLAAAARALRDGETVSRAAVDCGFTTPSYFGRAFRRRFGVAPAAYARGVRSSTR
jgi:AraC-like DNA-binding protein